MTFKNCTTPLSIDGGLSNIISSCAFIDNGNDEVTIGGSISISSANVSISNSSFHFNIGYFGGAINGFNTTVLFSQVSFFNNTAALGGSVYVSGSSVTCVDCNFTRNTAYSNGAGFYGLNSKIQVKGGVGINHKASSQGGFIYGSNSQIEILHTELANNEAISGGSIFLIIGKASIIGSAFESNSITSDRGSAMYFNKANITIESSKIRNSNARAVHFLDCLSILLFLYNRY